MTFSNLLFRLFNKVHKYRSEEKLVKLQSIKKTFVSFGSEQAQNEPTWNSLKGK